jgi:hypothetical protein
MSSWTRSTQTLTFDSLVDSGFGTPIPDGYGGLTWDNFGVLNTTALANEGAGDNGYLNGTVSAPNVAFNEFGNPASFSAVSGTFTLESFDLTAAWNNGLDVLVEGLLNGVVVDSTNLFVNTGGPTLETLDWSGLDEVYFASSGGTPAGFPGGFGEQFALDNLTLSTAALFTSGADTVNFNSLTQEQQDAIQSGADLYHGLGGSDLVTLPDANPGDKSVTIAGTNTTFDLTQPFVLGDNAGDTTFVTGGSGSYNIALGAGSDAVTINGDGNSNITAGSGSDTITISGTGTSSVTTGSGPETLSISGGGTLVVNGNLSGGSASVGANSILELNGTDSGTITFNGAGATLKVDGLIMPTGTVSGIEGNKIDLGLISLASLNGETASWSGDQLSISASGGSESFELSANQSKDLAFFTDSQGNAEFTTADFGVDGTTEAGLVLDATNTLLQSVRAIKSFQPGNLTEAEFDAVFGPFFSTLNLALTAIDVNQIYQKWQSAVNSPTATSADIANAWHDAFSEALQVGVKQTHVATAAAAEAVAEAALTGVAGFAAEGAIGGYLSALAIGAGVLSAPVVIGVGTAFVAGAAIDVYYDAYLKQSVNNWIEQKIIPLADQIVGITALGYLFGATVFADANGNGQIDSGEVSATTDSKGTFVLSGGSGPLIAFGGTDTSTGLSFKGQLSAPAGSTAITPLTTLLTDLASDPSAQQKILSALGLSSTLNLTMFDPIAATQGGSADGAATEVAGAKVYDTVEMIASALAGAGGTFTASLQAAFAALASTFDGSGINLNDKTGLSALITQVAQAENVSLGNGLADNVAAIIAAGNAALDHVLQTDQPGTSLLNDKAAVELVMQGPASTAIEQAVNNTARLQSVVGAFTGTSLGILISNALNQLGPDHDAGEQTALQLTVNTGAATPIGASGAGTVPFTTAGLDLEDSGTVTFTDGNGKAIQVSVNGGQTS